MKAIVLTLTAFTILFSLMGCGSTGSNSNAPYNPNCGPTGCTAGPYSPYGYGYGTPYANPNTAVYQTTSLNVTNGAAWDQVMSAAGVCSSYSCSGIGQPTLRLTLEDDTFSTPPTGTSPGQIQFLTASFMGAGVAAPSASANFYPINSNSGFEANISVGPTYSWYGGVNSAGGLLQIQVNGSPTAGVNSTASVQLIYDNSVIGSGTAVRIQ